MQTRNPFQSITGSYSQVFFSDNQWLGLTVMAASFFDPNTGISGLLCVVFAALLSYSARLNESHTRNGSFLFNALLTGLAMGAYYRFSVPFVVVLLFASLISLLITTWLSALFGKYKLPFLSLPFILSTWIILLNVRGFHFPMLELRVHPGSGSEGFLEGLSQQVDAWPLPVLLKLFFRSMGSIFFQHNLLAGMLITIGLLAYSRIALSLSWLGFFCGYLFFKFVQGNAVDEQYAFTGINYILTAIGLGGFFFVPSKGSYLLVVLATPVIALLSTALFRITEPYSLPLYSLSFTLTVIIFMSALQHQYSLKFLSQVQYQLYSPEKNVYAFHTYMERFRNNTFVHIHLPFYGEWFISQGHAGELTHKEDWRFAWDFVVTDEEQHTYRMPGKKREDFYCYSLPVLAPADGHIVTIQDGTDDNSIGDVNLAENWGNTVVIKHNDYLYSKISHLKKSSIPVKTGDAVKKGDLIGLCGNSGRSPEPHIHFQLQSTPYIGAKTLEYPISYYVTQKEGRYRLHSFEIPKEGETIVSPRPTQLLKQALHFVPGMKMEFEVNNGKEKFIERWEVFTDISNNSYLYCERTKSVAYFTNNGTLFYFIRFAGDKNSLLYYFFLGLYKVLLSYFPGMEIEDRLTVQENSGSLLKIAQDFIVPFHIFLNPYYRSHFSSADNAQVPTEIVLKAETFQPGNGGKKEFEIGFSKNKIKKITVTGTDLWLTAESI